MNSIPSPAYGSNAQSLVALLKKSGIVGAKGIIRFDLLETEVKISDKNAIGSLLQEWLGQWMRDNHVFYRVNHNTQEFPDFYLGKDDDSDLLEVKTFDYTKSPNFDVANFDAYTRSLKTKASRLDADYLIMGYVLSDGEITIHGIWLKKVWEITCPSDRYALRTQVKQNKIVNIRPYNFKSGSQGFQPFKNRLAFVRAIRETLEKYSGDSAATDQWFLEVCRSYKKATQRLL